ncbi:protein phosphatase 2C domain-containing protein [Actinacidiphila bryophytorum]|uniref:Protein phosphatase 2C domain-containing protein n=1 Tax=Actinacidiphila bryophytorum TaxID=1436133 RepID=A0A9W4GYN6_9ACTN|nr:protein phosphatase 2C domain-containing protein [Actinacidiphila bryophytorum]MBM9437898.1 protein phosphatase 2C domain-containing protein [Actinacidiphila bryophytorum]MBN6545939.1 protein phosphatase 2C domain-containing protein [Actinacidiphila bryophytorum]CAG7623116.1 Protein phosphatase 2C domain-containing protein [Actinacidiphila bryophytorum]
MDTDNAPVPAGPRDVPPPAAPPPPPWQSVQPWQRITVGTPGPEFEALPPGEYAYDVPDTECDGWSTGELAMRFASVRGAKHRYYRQPRQDAARAAVHAASGSVVFAVADGVSSASEAEQGAVAACRAAVERMLDLLDGAGGRVDLRDVACRAADRLGELTRWRLGGKDPEFSEVAGLYATTLVAGVVRPHPEGPVVEVCRVGDSGAWALDRASGRYQQLFPTKTGTDVLLVSSTVTPLPHVPDPLEQTGRRLSPGEVLLVGTDGFADPLGDGDGQVGSLFAAHLARPLPPLWLAHLLDFSRETFDDDRTLLAVWPSAPGGRR